MNHFLMIQIYHIVLHYIYDVSFIANEALVVGGAMYVTLNVETYDYDNDIVIYEDCFKFNTTYVADEMNVTAAKIPHTNYDLCISANDSDVNIYNYHKIKIKSWIKLYGLCKYGICNINNIVSDLRIFTSDYHVDHRLNNMYVQLIMNYLLFKDQMIIVYYLQQMKKHTNNNFYHYWLVNNENHLLMLVILCWAIEKQVVNPHYHF